MARIVSALQPGARASGWKTSPSSSFGKKYVDFCGIVSPAAATASTSATVGARRSSATARACGLRGHGVGRLARAAAVADAVGDGDRACVEAERPVEHERADRPRRRARGSRPTRRGAPRPRVAGRAACSRRAAVARAAPEAEGRRSRGAAASARSSASTSPSTCTGSQSESRRRRGPRCERGIDAGHDAVRRERLEARIAAVREVDRREVVRLLVGGIAVGGAALGAVGHGGLVAMVPVGDHERRLGERARRSPRAPPRRRSARAGDRCRRRRARRAAARCSTMGALDGVVTHVRRVVVDREDRREVRVHGAHQRQPPRLRAVERALVGPHARPRRRRRPARVAIRPERRRRTPSGPVASCSSHQADGRDSRTSMPSSIQRASVSPASASLPVPGRIRRTTLYGLRSSSSPVRLVDHVVGRRDDVGRGARARGS